VEWARTGLETPQYAGREQRDADIERCSKRTRDEHLAALAAAGAAFAGAARSLPADRWAYEVRGIGGDPAPVSRFLFGRLREIEIHHVDLDASYRPADWDPSFVKVVLGEVPARLGPRASTPFGVRATDLGVELQVGRGRPSARVEGEGAALLAWLLGRSDGSDLDSTAGSLPRVPRWG
jgi:maleylpyruvate isomerase